MNRFLLKGLASVLTMAVMFGTVSCSDDDDKPDGSVAVSAGGGLDLENAGGPCSRIGCGSQSYYRYYQGGRIHYLVCDYYSK